MKTVKIALAAGGKEDKAFHDNLEARNLINKLENTLQRVGARKNMRPKDVISAVENFLKEAKQN